MSPHRHRARRDARNAPKVTINITHIDPPVRIVSRKAWAQAMRVDGSTETVPVDVWFPSPTGLRRTM